MLPRIERCTVTFSSILIDYYQMIIVFIVFYVPTHSRPATSFCHTTYSMGRGRVGLQKRLGRLMGRIHVVNLVTAIHHISCAATRAGR